MTLVTALAPHSSWRHTMNKTQKLSSVAHLILVSFVDNVIYPKRIAVQQSIFL
jgi:energy-coupling factor transporter transmembrane protein EcfT